MTPVSFGLTVLGLVSFFWPLATVLCKRNVLNSQWLMMLAMSMTALTFILLGCMFNTFLQREYLLLILFLDVIIITPPIIYIAINVLTQQNSSKLTIRMLFLPSLLTIALMILSVVIGGADMYLLWTARGLEGLSGVFFPNSWRYNLIVVANFYVYWTVFTVEALFIFIGGIRKYYKFRRFNSEYYTSDRFRNLNLKKLFIAANLGLFFMALSQFTQCFQPGKEYLFYFTYCLPLAIILLYIGHSVYMINSGAEQLPRRSRSRRDPAALAHQTVEYVEKEKAFLNPDLSVFMLAEHLHTSEDDIIDAIHYSQGIPFGDYIDSLRVQHAVSIILAEHLDKDNPDTLVRIAHQSGFLSTDALENAWDRIFHTSIEKSQLFN